MRLSVISFTNIVLRKCRHKIKLHFLHHTSLCFTLVFSLGHASFFILRWIQTEGNNVYLALIVAREDYDLIVILAMVVDEAVRPSLHHVDNAWRIVIS